MNISEEIKQLIQSFIKKEETFYMNAFDMEKIIESVYGVYVEMLESPNDTTHEFRVQKIMDEYDQRKVAEAIQNKSLECYKYGSILNDLCQKGLISPGKYFLNMSW